MCVCLVTLFIITSCSSVFIYIKADFCFIAFLSQDAHAKMIVFVHCQSVSKLMEAGVLVKCVEVLKNDSVWEMITSSGAFCLLGV